MPRWSLICCYNTRHNDKYVREGSHNSYLELERWPDEKILELGKRDRPQDVQQKQTQRSIG